MSNYIFIRVCQYICGAAIFSAVMFIPSAFAAKYDVRDDRIPTIEKIEEGHRIYMPYEIRDVKYFIGMLHVLRSAPLGSEIEIISAGYGGAVMTLAKIISAIQDSDADITITVDGPSYSAHAILACAAPTLKMSQSSFLMYHTIQSGGSALDYEGMHKGLRHLTKYFLYELCSNILTKKQSKAIVIGLEDVYILPDEVGSK